MATNDFQAFAVGVGANVESQAAYLTDPALGVGQQPGIASSALNNKVLRQATVPASQLAQLITNVTGISVVDNGNASQFLSMLQATMQFFAPTISTLTSGSGTWNSPFLFFVVNPASTVSASATYTDSNSTTFTVLTQAATSATVVYASGGTTPALSGTLTKTGGSGPATLTYYAIRAPLCLEVEMVGGGGGGGAAQGGSPGSGGTGGNTTFGTSLLMANGGNGGVNGGSTSVGGTGGTGSVAGAATAMIIIAGASGTGGAQGATQFAGGGGGSSAFGGAGGGGQQTAGFAAATNSGSGGGGGSPTNTANSAGGGGSGAYVKALIASPLASYSYSIGSAGTAGAVGTGGSTAGGAGGSGYAVVSAKWQ